MKHNTFKLEDDLINLQIGITIIFLVSVVLSTLISYNQKMLLEEKPSFWSREEEYYINLAYRTLAIIIVLVYLYIAIEAKKIGEMKKENLKGYDLDILVSTLFVIAAFISFYVAKNYRNFSDIENPNV